MDPKFLMYLAYLAISIGLTIWVATTLSRNGLLFLEDVFANARLAKAVNHLLVVGFYLLNLGFVMLYLRGGGEVADLTGLFETISVKIGIVMLVLGVIHFVNVIVFSSMRRRSRVDARRVQVPPAMNQPYAPYPPQPQH